MLKNKKLVVLILGAIILIAALLLVPKYIDYTNTKNWERIKLEFSKCNVTEAGQAHSLRVEVTLKDGTKISAKEPRIDDISVLVREAGKKCGKTPMYFTE